MAEAHPEVAPEPKPSNRVSWADVNSGNGVAGFRNQS